ncbi:MAG: tetratricopeptide repeat protein [Myxococcota bacterium]|nr:tetratricopeptide repeat protein [Myxococcota bacterium]
MRRGTLKKTGTRGWRTGLAAVSAAAALFGAWPASSPLPEIGQPAHAQGKANLTEAQGTVDFVKRQLGALEDRYLKPELLRTEFSLETRFNDARVAYELKQFDRASYLFLDVISRSDASFGGYRASHYFLADSLAKQRNFIGARTYLKELIAMGKGEYHQEALVKFLEIAYATDNYEGVQEIYTMLDSNTNEAPALSYLRGKTLYEQENYSEARKYFMRSATAREFENKGRYFAAVTLVNEGNLDEANKIFEALTKGIPNDPGDLRVYYLSYLSLGRVAYEQEKYQDALLHYNRIERDDPNFIDATYESAWANIQLERFEQAGRLLDTLLLAEPDPETYTRALLLKADLAMRVDDYDTALESYETVLERFEPVRQQLDDFAKEHEDLRGFFRSLVREDLTLDVPEGLPTIRTDFKALPPEKWLTQDEKLEQARQLIDDVGLARVNLLSAFDDLEQIEARLNSGAAVKSFPKLAEGMALVTELESQLINVQRLLVSKLSASISPSLTGADKATWDAIRQDLDMLEARYKVIPEDAEALKEREKQVSKDFQRLREQLNEVGYSIDQVRAELTAIETYMQLQDVPLSEEERAEVDALREELRQTIKALEDEQVRLRAEIARARESVGAGDVVSVPERSLRQLYMGKLAEASDFLLTKRSLAKNPSELAQIERLRGQIPPLYGRISSYYVQMDGIVGTKADEVRKTLANLRKVLQTQSGELDLVTQDSKGFAGDVALQTFVNRREQFTGIVLRADVGKIDVLFQSKEDSTNKINDLFQKRTNELRALQEAFEEVR